MTASTNVAIDLNHRRHRPWSRSKYGARLQSPILPGSNGGHLLQSPVYRGWRGTKEVTGVRTPHKVGYHGPLTVAVLAFVETPKNVSEGSEKVPKSRNRPPKSGFRPQTPDFGGRFHWVPGGRPQKFSAGGGGPRAEMKKVVDPPLFLRGLAARW